jgi:diaminopimelate decarboxylase
VLAQTLRQEAARHRLPLPELDLEPGRAIVGPPGIALYRVGTRKRAPDGRRIVAVDGGIADNPRPVLYGARYHALLANRAGERAAERVVIAGRYCEAGDIMIPDLRVPAPRAGDVLAVAAAGAYCLAMASNYNGALRPPIVFLRRGRARLIRRRETVADLLRCEAH